MQQFLLALCGIPSSGKTTLASAIESQPDFGTRIEIVSTDRWRDEEFYSDFRPEKEHNVRKKALETTRKLIREGVSVIHDDTNYYASMRHELYEIAMERACIFTVVYVSTSAETAVRWNQKRGSPIPEQVIRKIEEKLDLPGSKYAWDRPIAEVDPMTQKSHEAAQEIVDRLMAIPPIDTQTDQIAQTSSSATLLDVATRQVVSRFLKERPEYMTDSRVSKLRREFLAEARSQGYSAYDVDQKLTKRLKNLDSHSA
ncbi:MAG: AAA family ATPase [Candidatus Thorarchaeota archaeon]|jgi:O-phosphoseryl-tRNA(Sec) kinase